MIPTDFAVANAGSTLVDEGQVTSLSSSYAALEEMFTNDVPEKKPEVEPEKTPDENPGIVPETKPNRDNDQDADDDDDDDDDDDAEDPFTEIEIGDDPDDIKTKTTIM